MSKWDLVIIGGGPAGLTAAIYALRARLNTVLLEKLGVGGQIALSDVVENYPGFPSISGVELMQKFEEHARRFGLKTENTEVQAIEDRAKLKVLKTSEGDYETKAVIVASGARPRRLGVPGEAEFGGRGVSYCATCDGFFFRGKDIVTVGGGDTAIKESLFLAKLVNKVTVVHRRDQLRAEKIHQELALANPKIEFAWDSVVQEIAGNSTVRKVVIKNVKTGDLTELPADGVFVFVGVLPNAGFVDADKDDWGFLRTDERMQTSIPGVFAAGDVRSTVLRQVSTAVGDAAIAAVSAYAYIESLEVGTGR